jgi:hypothetical protein
MELWRVVRAGPTRRANDHSRLDNDPPRRPIIAAGHTILQQQHRQAPNLVHRMVHGRQRRVQMLGDWDVVEPNYRNVVGHTYPGGS